MNKDNKKEILFYYESKQNPNGDPGFENQPRLLPDQTIMVTDVRIKRTIRDYAKNKLGKTIYVDFGKNGLPVKADERAIEILPSGKLDKNSLEQLLTITFDAPLFGAIITDRGDTKSKKETGGSLKLTGPAQFGFSRSVNKVSIINPQIVGRFSGASDKSGSTTFGKFYSVEYALIKVFGGINPHNLGEYLDYPEVKNNFDESEKKFVECLWEGTNELITRSKFPQRSILFIEVEYKGNIYNDLPNLVTEIEMDKKTINLPKTPFNFEKLIQVLSTRKDKISGVRLKSCEELKMDVDQLENNLKEKGLKVERL